MESWLLVPVLGAAIGTDLGLTLLVGLALTMFGPANALSGVFTSSAGTIVLAAIAVLYLVETLLEQVSVTVMALWHAAQMLARPLAGFLLAWLMSDGAPAVERLVAAVAMMVIAFAVHAGAVGWQAFLRLSGVPRRTRWIASLSEDVAVVALLVLGLEHPAVALALLLTLGVVGLPLHLSSIAAFQLLVQGVVGDARRLIELGSWWQADLLPDWLIRRHPTPDSGALTLKGTPAALLEVTPRRLRYGWLVSTPSGAEFMTRFGGRTPLSQASNMRFEEQQIFTRIELADNLVAFIPPGGPAASELESEFLRR